MTTASVASLEGLRVVEMDVFLRRGGFSERHLQRDPSVAEKLAAIVGATAPIAFRGRMTPHHRRMQTRLPHRPDALLLQDPIGLGARRRRRQRVFWWGLGLELGSQGVKIRENHCAGALHVGGQQCSRNSHGGENC